jgi:HemY protein
MRGLAWVIAIFSLAVLVALIAHYGEGYVLVIAPPWRIEVSLVMGAAILAVAFLLLHFLLRLIGGVMDLPKQVQAFRSRKQTEKGRAAMAEALLAYLEGRYGHAEKAAGRAIELGEAPLQNALIAAAAAHRVRNPDRRDEWLKRAESLEGGNPTARLMSAAELLLDDGRHAEALQLLDRLHAAGPRHIATLRLTLRAQQQGGRWDESLRVLRQLEKRNAIPESQAALYKLKAHQELMRQRAHDATTLAGYWDQVPASEQRDPRIAAAAARYFIQLGDSGGVRRVIEHALEAGWSAELAGYYGDCVGADALPRLERAEAWLKAHPREPELLRALGKLCMAERLWGKAQSYLDASLSLQPSRATYLELAKLLEQIGRNDEANVNYRKAAAVEDR